MGIIWEDTRCHQIINTLPKHGRHFVGCTCIQVIIVLTCVFEYIDLMSNFSQKRDRYPHKAHYTTCPWRLNLRVSVALSVHPQKQD